MGRCFLLIISFGISLGFSPAARAYVATVADDGRPIRWAGERKILLAGNPTNRSSIAAAYFNQAVVRSLQRWQKGSGNSVSFDYWQGTDTSKFEPNSELNGLSSVYFASQQNAGAPLVDNNTLAVTQVYYDTDTLEIQEADVVLNDLNYQFSGSETDTSGYGSGQGQGSKVFIENVMTHELGHAYGLAHSGGQHSTMLYLEAPEQAHLSCDDQVGIRSSYYNPMLVNGGALTGTVLSSSGTPVFGAHVIAISQRRGTVLATSITDSNGKYTIRALEPGSYYLGVEPFYAGAQALPGFYQSIETNLCGSQNFGRSFLTEGDGYTLRAVVARASELINVPSLTAKCGSGGGAAVSASVASSIPSAAPVLLTGNTGGFGAVDRISASTNAVYYRLEGVSGRVEIRALSFSLYSPVRPILDLLDDAGQSVSSQKGEPVYIGGSGYVDYDSALIATDLPSGDYVVKITTQTVDVNRYPAGSVYRDQVPFVLVTGTANAGAPVSAGVYPFNSRCLMDEDFSTYTSPEGDPQRTDAGGSGGGFLGFCGTISKDHPEGGGGATPMQILSWFLPFGLMFLTVYFGKSARIQKVRHFRSTGLMGLLFLALVSGNLAQAAVGPLAPEGVHPVDSKKRGVYLKDGLFVGGDRAVDDVAVMELRRAKNQDGERIVLDIEGNRESGDLAVERPPYFQVGLEGGMKRLTVTVFGRPKLAFNAKAVQKAFANSSMVKKLQLFPVVQKDRWTFSMDLKNTPEIEVFNLTNPVRIVLDIRPSKR